MDLGIQGKVALVTGGAGGIGLAIARQLADEGCRVAVADIDEAALAALPDSLSAWRCDVTAEQDLQLVLGQMTEELGHPSIVVSNAGWFSSHRLAETSLEEWRRLLEVNLTSAFSLAKLVLPGLQRGGWGRMVFVASLAGKVGGLIASPGYSAAKAGLMCLAKSVAREGAPDVTANAVAPAFISTNMIPSDLLEVGVGSIPVQRLGTAEEVAAAVSFLVSMQAGYITGEVLDLNGGLLMD